PPGVYRHRRALLVHDSPKLFDTELAHQKLDARCSAILLLAKPRENAGNGLTQRQQFFFRHKSVKKFRLVKHYTKASANIKLESSLLSTILNTSYSDATHIVHVRERAGFFPASGKRDLEFPAKSLSIGMPKQEF